MSLYRQWHPHTDVFSSWLLMVKVRFSICWISSILAYHCVLVRGEVCFHIVGIYTLATAKWDLRREFLYLFLSIKACQENSLWLCYFILCVHALIYFLFYQRRAKVKMRVVCDLFCQCNQISFTFKENGGG